MKKLKFLGVVAAATVLLTSCLDGGNNERSGYAYGVAGFSMDVMKNVVYTDNDISIYSPQFSELTEGDCVLFGYTINYDDPVNQGSPKYITAAEASYTKLDNKGVVETVVDTTSASIKPNEITAVDAAPLFVNAYSLGIKNYVFLGSSHAKSANDQTNSYTLQIDPSQEPQSVDGNDVYDLFLRVVKVADGKNTVGNSTFNYAIRAGNVISMLESKEKAKSKEAIYFRLNYIKEFNADTTAATWAKSQVFGYKIHNESK